VLRVIGHGGCLWRMDVAAGWLCGLALDVAWPPQALRCGGMRCVWGSSAARTTCGLAQIPRLGTAGRFCHHLRERQTAGLVVQRLRNGYAVPAGWSLRAWFW